MQPHGENQQHGTGGAFRQRDDLRAWVRFNLLTYTLGGQGPLRRDGHETSTLFGNVIARQTNIRGVFFVLVDAEFRQVTANRAGLPVYEMLSDHQDMADGISSLAEELRENDDGFDHSVEIMTHFRRAWESDFLCVGLDAF